MQRRRHQLVTDWLLALVLAGILGVPTVWLLITPGTEAVAGAAPATLSIGLGPALGAVAGAHLAVGMRRSAPRISFAIAMTCVAVLSVLSIWWFLPSTLVALVAVYSLCAHGLCARGIWFGAPAAAPSCRWTRPE